MNMARVAAMKAGVPVEVPAQTINRFCSSGLQTIASAAERIMGGFADCIIAGGAESMSLVPMGGSKYSANPGPGGQLAGSRSPPWGSPPNWWRKSTASPGRPGRLCRGQPRQGGRRDRGGQVSGRDHPGGDGELRPGRRQDQKEQGTGQHR